MSKASIDGLHKLVVFGIRESTHKTFGKYLAGSIVNFQVHPTETRFRFIVPPSLCCSTKYGDVLPVSSYLGILDDLSSMAAMAGDSNHRTGVSLSLSAEVFQPRQLQAHDEIDVICKVDKIGRSVGFLSIEFSVDNTVVARGTHNKFMPTGWLWETFLSDRFLPVGLWFFNTFAGPGKYKTPSDFLFNRSLTLEQARAHLKQNPPLTLSSPVDTVFSLFPIKPHPITPVATSSSFIKKVPPKMPDDALSFMCERRKETVNYVGLMHGGAVGAAIEKACRMAAEQDPDFDHDHWVAAGMEVRYLSASKGDLLIDVWRDHLGLDSFAYHPKKQTNNDKHRRPRPRVTMRGHVRNPDTHMINAQFTLLWEPVIPDASTQE